MLRNSRVLLRAHLHRRMGLLLAVVAVLLLADAGVRRLRHDVDGRLRMLVAHVVVVGGGAALAVVVVRCGDLGLRVRSQVGVERGACKQWTE